MIVLSSNFSTVGCSEAITPLTQALPSLYLMRVPTENSPLALAGAAAFAAPLPSLAAGLAAAAGFSAALRPESLRDYEFPSGPVWRP